MHIHMVLWCLIPRSVLTPTFEIYTAVHSVSFLGECMSQTCEHRVIVRINVSNSAMLIRTVIYHTYRNLTYTVTMKCFLICFPSTRQFLFWGEITRAACNRSCFIFDYPKFVGYEGIPLYIKKNSILSNFSRKIYNNKLLVQYFSFLYNGVHNFNWLQYVCLFF